MFKKIKPYMMPVAMGIGAVFYQFFGWLSFLTPYLIFTMLFLTYCHLKVKDIKLSRLHLWLIMIQFGFSLTVYFLLRPYNELIAQGAMICILAPTGTAAPVMTGMLKGNVASITAYSLISNMLLAVLAPVLFSFVGSNQSLPFWLSVFEIAQRVFLLLILPFAIALLLKKVTPALTNKIGSYSGLSFYLWTIALAVVTGRTVEFILKQNAANHTIEILLAVTAFVACIGQFAAGKSIGKMYGESIAAGQSIGQKNTILAIWMAQTFLHPISSIAPGAYVLWQNMVNSFQVWLKRKTL